MSGLTKTGSGAVQHAKRETRTNHTQSLSDVQSGCSETAKQSSNPASYYSGWRIKILPSDQVLRPFAVSMMALIQATNTEQVIIITPQTIAPTTAVGSPQQHWAGSCSRAVRGQTSSNHENGLPFVTSSHSLNHLEGCLFTLWLTSELLPF